MPLPLPPPWPDPPLDAAATGACEDFAFVFVCDFVFVELPLCEDFVFVCDFVFVELPLCDDFVDDFDFVEDFDFDELGARAAVVVVGVVVVIAGHGPGVSP